jgi:hypothetical protein
MKIAHVLDSDPDYNRAISRFIWNFKQVVYEHDHEVVVVTGSMKNPEPEVIDNLMTSFVEDATHLDVDLVVFHDCSLDALPIGSFPPYLDIKYTPETDAMDDQTVVLSNYLAFEYPTATVVRVPGIAYQGRRVAPNALVFVRPIDDYSRHVLLDLATHDKIKFVANDFRALPNRDIALLCDRLITTESTRSWRQGDVAYFGRSGLEGLDSVGDRVGSCYSSGTLPVVYGVGAWKEYLPPGSDLVFNNPKEAVTAIERAFAQPAERERLLIESRAHYESKYSANQLRHDLLRLIKHGTTA